LLGEQPRDGGVGAEQAHLVELCRVKVTLDDLAHASRALGTSIRLFDDKIGPALDRLDPPAIVDIGAVADAGRALKRPALALGPHDRAGCSS
jgi:hypothetical protein